MTHHLSKLELALCRSGLYEALAIGFRSPNNATVTRLLAREQNQALADLAALVDVENGSSQLSERVRELTQDSNANELANLQDAYRHIFGHTAHPKVPPYETEYGQETLFQQPQQLGDISGFYQAFGLKLNPGEHERFDHVSCECEFLAFLTRKEAYALEKSDLDMQHETRKAQKLFLKDHLARFLPALANLLKREAPLSFYARLGRLAHEFVLTECARFQIKPGPRGLQLRPKTIGDECFSCGAGQEIIKEMQNVE